MSRNIIIVIMNKPPEYDGKESFTQYMRKFNSYLFSLEKDKYDVILEFINEWISPLNIKVKKLTDFKNIEINKLISDEKNCHKLLRKYTKIFSEKFKIDTSINDDTDSDDIKTHYIIYFTNKILKSINFSLYSKVIKDSKYYFIKNNKKVT